MGKIYARLIYKYVTYGINTGYKKLSDVPVKYQGDTKIAYKELFGADCPNQREAGFVNNEAWWVEYPPAT